MQRNLVTNEGNDLKMVSFSGDLSLVLMARVKWVTEN